MQMLYTFEYARPDGNKTVYMVALKSSCANPKPCYAVAAAWDPMTAMNRLHSAPRHAVLDEISAEALWNFCKRFGWREPRVRVKHPAILKVCNIPFDVKIFVERYNFALRDVVIAVREARDDGNCGFFPSVEKPTRKWRKTQPMDFDKNYKRNFPEAKVFAFAASGCSYENDAKQHNNIEALTQTALARLECRPNYIYAKHLTDKGTFQYGIVIKGYRGPRRNKPKPGKTTRPIPREIRPIIESDLFLTFDTLAVHKEMFKHFTIVYQLEGNCVIWYGAACLTTKYVTMTDKERKIGTWIAKGRCWTRPRFLTLSTIARNFYLKEELVDLIMKHAFKNWYFIVQKYGCSGATRYNAGECCRSLRDRSV